MQREFELHRIFMVTVIMIKRKSLAIKLAVCHLVCIVDIRHGCHIDL